MLGSRPTALLAGDLFASLRPWYGQLLSSVLDAEDFVWMTFGARETAPAGIPATDHFLAFHRGRVM